MTNSFSWHNKHPPEAPPPPPPPPPWYRNKTLFLLYFDTPLLFTSRKASCWVWWTRCLVSKGVASPLRSDDVTKEMLGFAWLEELNWFSLPLDWAHCGCSLTVIKPIPLQGHLSGNVERKWFISVRLRFGGDPEVKRSQDNGEPWAP